MTTDTNLSLQDQFAPNLICFGCGPANEYGLRLKSFVSGQMATNGATKVVATFTPAAHQLAFEGIVNGGIIGTLLDCHMNWTAAWHLMNQNVLSTPPCCVTAKFEITFLAPTPAAQQLQLEAWMEDSSERKAMISATLGTASEITATGTGTFVAVKPGHPAYHRW